MRAKWQRQAYAAVMRAHDELWPACRAGSVCMWCGGGDQHKEKCAFHLLQLAALAIKTRRPLKSMDRALKK